MLVLTRKRTEMIKIGEDIVITVIHSTGNSVKLGIQAPTNVRVLRAELCDRMVSTVNAGAATDPDDGTAEGPVFATNHFPMPFSVDYVAELEDQTLLCLAK
jgi:carbon storage regulator